MFVIGDERKIPITEISAGEKGEVLLKTYILIC